MTIFDLIYEKDRTEIYSLLSNPTAVVDPLKNDIPQGNTLFFLLIKNDSILINCQYFREESVLFLPCEKRWA